MKHYIKKTAQLFSILATILFNASLFGQTSPSRRGKAVYLFSQNHKYIPYVCDAELLFDEKSSVYTDGKNVRDTEDMQKYDENGNLLIYRGQKGVSGKGTVFYSDFTDGKTVQWLPIQGRPFVISDTLRTPEWRLLDDTKEIHGMKCQKAVAKVYGREYEAWFSADIPIPYGPWKLNGLPGLILEARSTDGEINFEIREIQQASNEPHEIMPPSEGKNIEGYANFFALQDKKTEEWIKAARAQVAERLQASGSERSAMDAIRGGGVRRIEKTPTF